MGKNDVVMHVDSSFQQVLLLERSAIIAPKPVEFLVVVTKHVTLADGLKKMRTSGMYKPRAWRWLNAKPFSSKPLMNVLGKERPSASNPILTYLEDVSSLKIWRGKRRKRTELARGLFGASVELTAHGCSSLLL